LWERSLSFEADELRTFGNLNAFYERLSHFCPSGPDQLRRKSSSKQFFSCFVLFHFSPSSLINFSGFFPGKVIVFFFFSEKAGSSPTIG